MNSPLSPPTTPPPGTRHDPDAERAGIDHTAEPPPPPPGGDNGRGKGGWRPVPVLAVAMLSAVLASGVTAAIVDDEPTMPVASESAMDAEEATTTPTAGAAEQTPVVDAEEPVAAAAAEVAPAVVQIETRTGVGSGVVYSDDGLILTVAHVVGRNSGVDVRLSDGSTVEGDVVGIHPDTDVAVVRIDPGDVIGVADLGTSEELAVGQSAVAVGSPFGFDQTVTSGIVSAVNRVVNEVAMVQTDAAINPGNSGGPLVDLDGRVIGLSDVIYSESGGSQGVGFAIHVDVAEIVADQLVAGETPQLALLGVSTTPAPDGSRGAQVAEVVEGPAADAGIEVGDVLVSVDGDDVAGGGQLRAEITRREPGAEVIIGLERDGERMDVEVTLGQTG
ncbi:MAG: trypsin-like peptidase domain-containing protein [Acidimicrobiales bacterium]|nr:trypsin-like peptidase domain-containing protein [Acidimicrobiales bacterium]